MNILEMAMAAKMGGGGTGPIDPKRLPEGYPYKEQSVIEVIPDTNLVFDGGALLNPFSFNPASGATYQVVWDGVEYVCSAQSVTISGTAAIVIGNGEGMDGAYGNNEPFYIMYLPSQGIVQIVYRVDPGHYGEHTISISEFSETIHTMAPEFLKLGNGLTVDENGAIALSLLNAEGGSF